MKEPLLNEALLNLKEASKLLARPEWTRPERRWGVGMGTKWAEGIKGVVMRGVVEERGGQVRGRGKWMKKSDEKGIDG